MQTSQRVPELTVSKYLPIEPQRYEFVQLVRTLLRWLHRQGVCNDEAFNSVLRFRNSVLLSFPPGQVESIQAEALDVATAEAFNHFASGNTAQHIVVTPAFMGLLGICGIMPHHYTERIAMHMQQTRDQGARALFDLCSNRLLAMYFQTWGKYRAMHQLDMEGIDGLQPLLAAIGGGVLHPENAEDADDESGSDIVARYAAIYRTRPISGSAVARVLTDHLRVPVTIEQFVGVWSGVAECNQTRLGKQNCTLGHGVILGKRQWRTDLRIRIHIGPIEKMDFHRFRPIGSARRALSRLLRLFGTGGLEYEVAVHLHPSCVAPMILTSKPNKDAPQYLGWNTFLVSSNSKKEDRTIRYMLKL